METVNRKLHISLDETLNHFQRMSWKTKEWKLAISQTTELDPTWRVNLIFVQWWLKYLLTSICFESRIENLEMNGVVQDSLKNKLLCLPYVENEGLNETLGTLNKC